MEEDYRAHDKGIGQVEEENRRKLINKNTLEKRPSERDEEREIRFNVRKKIWGISIVRDT